MDESVSIQEATTSIGPMPSLPSYRPDAKTRRYDRQLRLWAKAGQTSLESARVLLIGADAVGCQALKNLILPGISHFTILSADEVKASDIATNFFLLPESLGQPIAEETVKYLKELNPSVQGEAKVAVCSELLRDDPDFFASFSLVVASNLPPSTVLELSDCLWELSNNERKSPDIPLILIRSTGFIGEMRLQYREHCVVDSHPDNAHTLRLDKPFSSLREHALALDVEAMDSMEHSHIPYVLLLIRAAETLKAKNGKSSIEWDDLESLKEFLFAERRALDEENFEEAESQVYKLAQPTEIPSAVKELFADPACENASKDVSAGHRLPSLRQVLIRTCLVPQQSKNFWLLVRALRDFTQASGGYLPVSGSLPDMKASTSSYVNLQTIYKQKARRDVQLFTDCLVSLLKRLDLLSSGSEASGNQTPASQQTVIDQEEIETFVKNCHGLTCLKGRSWRQEIDTDTKKEAIISEIDNESTAMGYYLALRGCERFWSTHARIPGSQAAPQTADDAAEETADTSDLGADARLVEAEVLSTMRAYGSETAELPDFVRNCVGEAVRGGAACLPTVAAFIGGLVGQEAVKLITGQYIPLHGTVIVDMVTSSLEKFHL